MASYYPKFIGVIHLRFPRVTSGVSAAVSPVYTMSHVVGTRSPSTIAMFIKPYMTGGSRIISRGVRNGTSCILACDRVHTVVDTGNMRLRPDSADCRRSSMCNGHFTGSNKIATTIIRDVGRVRTNVRPGMYGTGNTTRYHGFLVLVGTNGLPSSFVRNVTYRNNYINKPDSFGSVLIAGGFHSRLLRGTSSHRVLSGLGGCRVRAFSVRERRRWCRGKTITYSNLIFCSAIIGSGGDD